MDPAIGCLVGGLRASIETAWAGLDDYVYYVIVDAAGIDVSSLFHKAPPAAAITRNLARFALPFFSSRKPSAIHPVRELPDRMLQPKRRAVLHPHAGFCQRSSGDIEARGLRAEQRTLAQSELIQSAGCGVVSVVCRTSGAAAG